MTVNFDPSDHQSLLGDEPAPGSNEPWGAGSPAAPGGPSSPQQLASATVVTGGTIQLAVDDQDFTFLPGTEVTVGRDPSCLVTLGERHSLVSRHHLKIIHRDEHWWIEDHSSKGTFIDGRRIAKPYKAEGAFIAQLGDHEAGTPMRVLTAGEHKPSRGSSLILIAVIAALVVLAVIALALLAFRGGDSAAAGTGIDTAIPSESPQSVVAPTSASTANDLASAKQSTVLLLSRDGGLGSGFFVTNDLIVTNQHVAALAPSLLVAVSRVADEPAKVEFTAETHALHPFLDVAVLRLTGDEDGNPVEGADLPPAVIGDSATLTLGDQVYNTGFPANLSLISRDDMGDLLLPPVSATSGQAASFSIWPGCSNPDHVKFIPVGSPPGVACAPDGDISRGIVLTTFSSGQGASGSPVFKGNEVIAVVFAGPEDEANAGRNITTASFTEWLEGVIASNA